MRTSPPAMRLRGVRRTPVLLLSVVALAAPLVACGGGDDDEGSTPTTTAPATTEATTTEADADPTTTEAGGDDTTDGGEDAGTSTTVAGDDATVLTAAEAEAQLVALLAELRQTVADAAAAQQLVYEATLASLGRTFTGAAASSFLTGLQRAGLPALNPAPAEIQVSGVEVTSTSGGCAAGTAEVVGIVGATGVVTAPVEVVQPYYFKLVPAPSGAASPAWRLDFLSFSTDGVPLAEATCE